MATVGEVLELLDGAADRWQTAHGRFREWRDQRLVNKAFEEEVAWRDAHSQRSRFAVHRFAVGASAADEADRPQVIEVTGSFWVEKPRRLRIERKGNDALLRLLVVDGDRWWSYSPERGAMTNSTDPSYGTGGSEVLTLLEADVVGKLSFTVEGETVVANRSCLAVRARRRESRDPMPHRPVLGMILGGQEFALAVEAERGVILRAVKLVDGEEAELKELTDVSFDVPIDPEHFVFTPPPGVPVHDVKDLHPRMERLSVEECVRLAPFTVFLPTRTPGAGVFTATYHPGPRDAPDRTQVTFWWHIDDGAHVLHLGQTSARSEEHDYLEWDRVVSDGRELFVVPADRMGGPLVKLELEGTLLKLGGSLDLESLIAVAQSLQPASSQPPKVR